MKVLILFAHPALEKSRVNRVLVDHVRDISGVTLHDLYEAYPDFNVDVKHEQRLLTTHDLFILHHPMFWYSTPALLKEWQDLVLEHGWAYGRDGNALRGKRMLSAITTGGGEGAYTEEGYNHVTIRELLLPIAKTAQLCGIDYLPHFGVHGTHAMKSPQIQTYADQYRRLVGAFRDDCVDLDAARSTARLNMDLSAIIMENKL